MTVGQLPAAPVAPPSADQDQPVAGGAAPEQQPQQPAAPPPAVVKDIRPSGQPIILQVSQGTVLQLPSDARTLFVADSGVADVTLTSPAIILVTAKKAGGTALYAMDEAGNILLNKFIEVRGGVSILRGTKEDTGAPPPGPMILQIPLQAAPPPQR